MGLCLLAVALAVAPLRTVLALPVAAGAAEEAAHCATMSHGAHSMEHTGVGMHDGFKLDPDQRCERGCGGDCCNGSCGTCVHAGLALPRTPAAGSDVYNDVPTRAVAYRYAVRTIPPPFRPPISLPG